MNYGIELPVFALEGVDDTEFSLIADGYQRKDGASSVPDKPGFGLTLHKEKFAAQVKPTFDLRG